MKKIVFVGLSLAALTFGACKSEPKNDPKKDTVVTVEKSEMQTKTEQFVEVELTSDISTLSDNDKKMLPLLFEAAQIMDNLFWKEAYGDKEKLLASAKDAFEKQFLIINYGPWERLNGNKPFVQGVGEKPAGAQFYPADMTEEEFKALKDKNKESLYTMIRRGEDGALKSVWYHEEFKAEIEKAADLLKQAAALADDAGFKKYLELRAEALLTDDYLKSDMAWMDMKTNTIDFVIGPIENYEDAMFGYKAAHEAYILIKDKVWSDKLARFAKMLPEMQRSLPVPDKYKRDAVGTNSDLGAYDVVYYAGDCNAGSKTIAINLPNDPRVHASKGSRRLQLKNAMRAKFDQIMVPISKELIVDEQLKHVTFNAFFENVMFHETAHGIGIKKTINGKGSVDGALKKHATTIEEGKADILGLFLITKLHEKGEFTDQQLMDNYVTFMAGIFRSVRFGVSSSHGKANMLRFYYFQEMGAFTRDAATGKYKIDLEKMKVAMTSLSEKILTIQGDGDFEAADKWISEKGNISPELQADLDRVNAKGIPVDVIFKQGLNVLIK